MRNPGEREFDNEAPTSVMQDELLQKLTERARRQDTTVSFDLLLDDRTAIAKRSAAELFAEAARRVPDGPSHKADDSSAPAVDELSATSKWRALREEPAEASQTPSQRKTALRRRVVAMIATALFGASLGALVLHHMPRRRTVVARAALATGKISMNATPTSTSPPTR